MRVLQLAQKPQRRGAEVFAAQLGAWLRSVGHEVRHAYLYRYPGSDPLPVGEADVCLEREQDTRLERLPCGNPGLLADLRRLVRSFEPDIVQANGGRSVKYAALLAMTMSARRWKLVYRNIDSPLFWVRGIARKVYFKHLVMPRVDGVVGVSRQTLQEAYALYELSVPGEYIANGIDFAPLEQPSDREAVRRSLGVPRGRLIVLFFGALTPQKRPDRFVRLVRRLRDAELDVAGWVLGDGEARAEMEELAAELRVSPFLHYFGYRQAVADYVAAADLFASTSDSEGIPAAVLEAGYLRLPTVGYDVGGMRECVLDGQTGLLAPAGDEDEHLRLVKRLLQDREQRLRFGESARAFVESEFAIEVVGRRYERFYRKVLDGNGSAAPSPER